ncbi:MAG: DUF58 domain-containing protein [Thermoplasmatota archaeon]
MISERGALLGLAVLALAGAGALERSWPLALAALALAVPLAASLVLFGSRPLALAARRERIPSVALAGDTSEIALAVANEGPATSLLLIDDERPDGVEDASDESAATALVVLGAGASAAIESRVAFVEPGRAAFSRLSVEARAPFGVAARSLDLFARASVSVHPRLEDAPDLDGFGKRRRTQLGPLATRRAGPGREFYGLRPYHSGDGLDVVNWKATARHARPIVNEYEPEVPADVVVLLDAREGAPREASVRAARAFAERMLRERHQVSLLAWGAGVRWVHPGSGARQRERILDALLDLVPSGREPLSVLARDAPHALLPSAAHVLVLTSAEVEDDDVPAALERLALRCERVVVVSPSPVALDDTERDDAGRAARAVATLERARRLVAIRERGVEVHDWDPATPLALLDVGGR